jgi:hypothetical protein
VAGFVSEVLQRHCYLTRTASRPGGGQASGTATLATADTDVLKPARRPLPDHLPRDIITHATACACPHCGGQLHRLGEDVTKVLDHRPAAFR